MGKGSEETTTTRLSQEDINATQAGRDAGYATADAAYGGSWAQPLDPMSEQAGGQYGQMYDAYGNLAQQYGQQFQQASQIGMGMGLEGLSGYMNPMLEQYYAGMDPMYQRAYAQAGQTAGQQATQQGAYGGSRSAILEGQMRGDVQRSQMADYGRVQYGAARDAAGMLMQDRARIGGYQGMYGGLGMDALSGQMGATGAQAGYGDYRRNVAQQQAMDEYMRRAAGQEAIQSGYGRDTERTTTSEKGGDLFGDILAVGGTAAGIAFPPAAPAINLLGGQPQAAPQAPQGANPWGMGGYGWSS